MDFKAEFIDRLKKINPTQWQKVLEGFKDKGEFGIRLNTAKISQKELKALVDDNTLKTIPFIKEAFLTQKKELYTKNPLMFSGSYFVQDAGSMAIVEALNLKPDMKVLDVCASPGSKSTHILAKLDFPGFLVANEVTHNRVGRLIENLAAWGKGNVLISSQKTSVYQYLNGFFDRILVDAPCSGEGMFAKNPESINQWNTKLIRKCSKIQKEILSDVVGSLKVGGELVYSTCTMAPEENEGVVQWLLDEYPQCFELVDISLEGVELESGLNAFEDLSFHPDIAQKTKRVYPYMEYFKHQSFYLAKLRLIKPIGKETDYPDKGSLNKQRRYQNLNDLSQSAFNQFLKEVNLDKVVSPKDVLTLGFFVYDHKGWDKLILKNLIELLHPVYVGTKIATIKKNRLEPREEIALSSSDRFSDMPFIDLDQNQIEIFMQGQTLVLNSEYKSGVVKVRYQSYNVGLGKVKGTELKSYFNAQQGKKILK